MAFRMLLQLAAAAVVVASAAPTMRNRQIDRLDRKHLFPADMHTKTRAAHSRMMRSWKAPTLDANSPVVSPVDFGADPTGKTDSTTAFAAALAAVLSHNTSGHVMSDGIVDLGGVVLDLGGGDYLLSQPLAIPQYFGNMRIIDGTLRASASFPADRYVVEVGYGTKACNPPSGQGSCNENVGMSGLTIDGSHVASGCIKITATMGATIDSSSAIFGFNDVGIALDGGHETMITETWVAAYFWSDPKKEHNDAIGIGVYGNDHFITNVIVFSARVGVQLTGAANLLSGVHTWNCATGNGGIGILNGMSQNRFEGCYLDFTDLVLTNAQQLSISNGFFLGGAQILFQAPKAGSTVYGVSIIGNVWYDTGSVAMAVNETVGTWTSVTDLVVSGTSLQQGQPSTTGLVKATQSQVVSHAGWINTIPLVFNFSNTLLFPNAPIASSSVQVVAMEGPSQAAAMPPLPILQAYNATGSAGGALTLTAYLSAPTGYDAAASFQVIVTADQSTDSTRTGA